jgi:hypothetical protein
MSEGRTRGRGVVRARAPFADVPEAAQALVGLRLDVEDTAVTRQTARALTRVGTVAAVRLVAPAVAGADGDHVDWLETGVHDALVGPDGAGTSAWTDDGTRC